MPSFAVSITFLSLVQAGLIAAPQPLSYLIGNFVNGASAMPMNTGPKGN